MLILLVKEVFHKYLFNYSRPRLSKVAGAIYLGLEIRKRTLGRPKPRL